jgi:hypothetical protein
MRRESATHHVEQIQHHLDGEGESTGSVFGAQSVIGSGSCSVVAVGGEGAEGARRRVRAHQLDAGGRDPHCSHANRELGARVQTVGAPLQVASGVHLQRGRASMRSHMQQYWMKAAYHFALSVFVLGELYFVFNLSRVWRGHLDWQPIDQAAVVRDAADARSGYNKKFSHVGLKKLNLVQLTLDGRRQRVGRGELEDLGEGALARLVGRADPEAVAGVLRQLVHAV